jgi:phage tail protein X
MKIKVFEPPLPDFDQMSYGGEVKPRKMFVGGMSGVGFNPTSFNFNNINDKILRQVQASIAESMQNMPNYAQVLADIETRLDQGLTEQDVQSQIDQAVSALPEGISEADVQRIIDANPGLTRADVLSIIEQNPGIQLSDVQSQIDQAVANLPEGITLSDVQQIVDANPGLTRTDVLSIIEQNPGIQLSDVQSQIDQALSTLPEGITEADVQRIVDANPGLTREDVVSLIQQNPGIQLSDVQSQIDQAIAGLPEGLTEADIQRVVDANPGLTREDVLSIVKANPGISFQDVESAINTALENAQAGISSSIEELRTLAERLYEEEGDFRRDPYEGDVDAQREIDREQFIENFIERNRDRLIGETPDFQQLIQNQINNQIQDGTIASGDVVTEQTLAERLAAGTLTPDEIQRRIDAGDITKQDVLDLIQGGFSFNESQFAQLFNAGILTREEIAALIDEAIAGIEPDEGITEEDVERIADATGLSEERVQQLISEQLEGFDPNIDTSQFATQEQLQGLATQEQLSDFATRQDLAGLESLFQNYLTPEQLQSYLPQEGQYVTPEQLAAATDNDYDEVIKGLTDQLGELESKYQDVQSQYEADAVNAQIEQTKDDLDTFFRGAVPSGPRTGSTSQFRSGASFLPGGSPMANLIAGQRQGLGQDPFSTYLRSFTPSYSAYDAPVTPEEYGQASTPLIGTQYNNPFTGGFNKGGQVSNGIMDLTNFDTNVQPFQNAFRPNVPRN